MTTKSKLQVMRIERHDVEKHSSYLPLPLTKPECWPPERLALLSPRRNAAGETVGYDGTRLSDIRWSEMRWGTYNGRMDIVLINETVDCSCKSCGNCHHKLVQHCVYPGKNGTLSGRVDLLSPEDLDWALKESAKCWANIVLRKYI